MHGRLCTLCLLVEGHGSGAGKLRGRDMKTRLAIAGGVLLIGSVFAAEMAAAQPATLADADRRRGCRRAGREGPVALLPLLAP